MPWFEIISIEIITLLWMRLMTGFEIVSIEIISIENHHQSRRR
jgi:hypothetical protein